MASPLSEEARGASTYVQAVPQYPLRFSKDHRSVEYKAASGWKLEPGGERLTFTDGYNIGRVKLVGTHSAPLFPGKHLVFTF
jgi:hypothetical protein